MTTTDRRRRRPRGVKLELVKKAAALEERTRLQIKAVDLRLNGKSYQQIADALQVDYHEAARLVQSSLKRDLEVDADKLDELRQLELGRIDKLWAVYFPLASNEESPNMAAAHMCMKLAKRRSELLGLDREVKAAPTVQMNIGTDAIRQVAEASKDPSMLEALEKIASAWAHGEVIDGEAEESGVGGWLAGEMAGDVHHEGDEPHEDEQGDDGETAAEDDRDDHDPGGVDHSTE